MKYSLPQHLVSDSLACLVASRENVGGLVREQEWQEIRIQIIQIVSKAPGAGILVKTVNSVLQKWRRGRDFK